MLHWLMEARHRADVSHSFSLKESIHSEFVRTMARSRVYIRSPIDLRKPQHVIKVLLESVFNHRLFSENVSGLPCERDVCTKKWRAKRQKCAFNTQ